MSPSPDAAEAAPLPDDVATLKALLLAERATAAKLAGHNEQLRAIVKELQRALFGRRSEKTADPDQLQLALEDIEQALAESEAEAEKTDATLQASRRQQRRVNRGALPKHLPREEVVIEPASTTCPCCQGALHRIGEDVAERLDVIPAAVPGDRHPPAQVRLPGVRERRGPGARAGAADRGRAADGDAGRPCAGQQIRRPPAALSAEPDLRPPGDRARSLDPGGLGRARRRRAPPPARASASSTSKRSPKLFMDETRAPVLDPGRRRTKTGYLWAIARDDRPWAGPDPPAVVYLYAPGRGAEHAIRPLAGFSGVLQVDAYAAYNALADPARAGGPVTLAYCWSHVRRRFYEIAQGGNAPIAEEALARIAALFGIERTIRGHAPEQRRTVRLDQTRPLIDDLRAWLEAKLAKVSGGSRIAQAIRYALKLWPGLTVFLDDGRVEIDSNVVERSIRPIALNRKNALFAGSDQGGVHWGVIGAPAHWRKLGP